MLRPPCKALLYVSARADVSPLLPVLKAAGCETIVVRDEAEAAEQKAFVRPECIFALGLPPGSIGRLRRLPPPLQAVYCALVKREELTRQEIVPEYDDYLILPLDATDVATRLTLWRWRQEKLSADGLLRAGPLVMDLAHFRVTINGAPVALTYKEYELLGLFLRRRGQLLSRAEILDLIWGPDYYGGSRTVDIHVRRLRMKLPEIADKIVTVHGLGYRFDG